MKHSSHSSLPVLALLLGTLTLVGCGGALNIPDSVASSQASGPAVSGTMYGGHAPITGAHVYLLQPSVTAYGGLATSILGTNGATSSNGHAITADVNDPNVPVGAKFLPKMLTIALGESTFTGGLLNPALVMPPVETAGAVEAVAVIENVTLETA